MDLEYLTVLEKRVQEMIALLKRLKQEKEALEIELREREEASKTLYQERGVLRERVENILATIKHLDEGANTDTMEQETEKATSY